MDFPPAVRARWRDAWLAGWLAGHADLRQLRFASVDNLARKIHGGLADVVQAIEMT